MPVFAASASNVLRPATEQTYNLRGSRILIVDDERDTCELFKFILEEAGAAVTLASSASQALSVVSNESFDLILADIGMPGEDGFSLISSIRALPNFRNTRAIAVTSYAGTQYRTRALAAGFDDYTTKPVQPVDLAQLVFKHLKGPIA
jgi:CheY-like chemotaxis protein